MTIARFVAAALCVLGPLTCSARGSNINSEATYISFSVPGALGTYPMSINASMTVTGYYYVSSAVTRGFLRAADGTITTFAVMGGVWTEPESINAAGNITGFYEVTAGVPQGFLRYANGYTIAFDPPATAAFPAEAQPVSISDFDDIVGNYQFYARFSVFTRSAGGVYKAGVQFNRATAATAINASGSVVGYATTGGGGGGAPLYYGFVLHPDGYSASISVPAPALPPGESCINQTFPDGINAAGAIAGWYIYYTNDCDTTNTGGFVLSPEGVFTLFQAQGAMVASPSFGLGGTDPHWISIDQAGDTTGSYTDAAGFQHGFVRNPYGTMTSFDPPESKQTTATSISDGGAVAGFYQYKSGGPPVAFIRIPG